MALVTIRRSPSVQAPRKTDEAERLAEDVGSRVSKSLNECYFANKGAALVLGGAERCARRVSPARAPQPDIQHHLQAMFYLLRPEETLKMAVKLESAHPGRTRYLVVVCRGGEAALLGIDCNERTTVGLVLRVLADTSIKLDGDGGFSVCVCSQQHIFKPVSVQAMWSALQTLHRASGRARELNHFAGGTSHSWAAYYEERVDSERSCLNEWHAMDCIESRRPPSPDSLRHKPRERDETERVIRCTLKEIMMSVDLDEVTSKAIRGRLEDDLDMDLAEYKSFIDQEMLTILGQMDAPTEIFDHVYLGSEWNASNLEELQRNGVRHILNVTREIDNFFPGMFDYLNIRVYDDDKTDLLKHWDNTFKYINKARNEGSKVLVHCKMGISRSASVVIAYAMKAYNWNFDRALKHVKTKRSCIKPNTNFLNQLETYQGILDAMKNKEKLQRSKSETNLKSPKNTCKTESKALEAARLALARGGGGGGGGAGVGAGCAGGGRPRSWSPDSRLAGALLPPTSVSLENLAAAAAETRHMLMPCAGGCYSVSPNQIIRLKEEGAPSVKHIVNEIENATGDRRDPPRRHQRLHFGTYGEPGHKPDALALALADAGRQAHLSPSRNSTHKYSSSADADKIHTWDPGETDWPRPVDLRSVNDSDNIVKSDSGIIDTKAKTLDAFSNLVDRIVDSDDKKQLDDDGLPPSRQSSWSSFDSAVVPDLSRQSSWGSYDTRAARSAFAVRDDTNKRAKERTDQRDKQRDIDLHIITEHADRTALDISLNERKFNETCAILKELAETQARMAGARAGGASTWCGRLGVSAPSDTWLRAGPRRRRLAAASHPDLTAAAPPPPPPHPPAAGLVSNRKKEFEALSGSAPKPDDSPDPDSDSPRRSGKSRSLPSDRPAFGAQPLSGDDLSVKDLVVKYDTHPCRPKCDSSCESGKARSSNELGSKKCKLSAEGEGRAPFLRNSFCGVTRGGQAGPGAAVAAGPAERPPIGPNAPNVVVNYPNVVVSTVMSKAQNKKQLQHGKTHPLTRLNNLNRSNNRCSNPVYNTM